MLLHFRFGPAERPDLPRHRFRPGEILEGESGKTDLEENEN